MVYWILIFVYMIKDLLKSVGEKWREFLQFQVYGVSLENRVIFFVIIGCFPPQHQYEL